MKNGSSKLDSESKQSKKLSKIPFLQKIARLCSVGYVQSIPGVLPPGIITIQRSSVSSVRH